MKFSINKITRLLCISGLIWLNLPAQILQPGESPVARYTGLMLHSSLNPAFIVFDYAGPSITYQAEYNTFEGEFKRAFDPGRTVDYYWTAAGLKALGNNQIFRGSFSYHRQSINGKMWVHARQPYIGVPFLLADSSVGGFNLNGIYWQMDYGVDLIPGSLAGGLSIYYNVDESYKTIFPKPKNNIRDLLISFGTGINTAAGYRIGLTGTYFNFQEINKTSKYSADQDLTPIFYKIRGFDNPLIFRGETSEERLTTLDGYAINIDLIKINGHYLSGQISGGMENARAHLLDGGSYPVEQGWWWSERYNFNGYAKLQLAPRYTTNCTVSGEVNQQTANHPELEIEVYSSSNKFISGRWSLGFQSSKNTAYSMGLSGYSQSMTQTDYYNGLLNYFPAVGGGADVNLTQRWFDKIDIGLKLGTLIHKTGNGEIFAAITGNYYNQVTVRDIAYYRSDWQNIYFEAKVVWFGNNLIKYSLVGKFTEVSLKNNNELIGISDDVSRTAMNIKLVVERLNQ
ncbi:MAG: hypothetical protein H8E14_05120 [Candidatus Marinimicrobia bacterium]|nr:hypothetical protein [Candidatus Neomarinimicrobiota bacterium]